MSKYIFLKKKIILGKTKKIYTKKESKKEYVKYKNCMINIAKYKKIKNNKGKKMKGGAKGPNLFKRTNSRSGRSFSTSTASSDIMYNRKLYASEKNIFDVTQGINGLNLSSSNSPKTSRMRFGPDKTHPIPSRQDTHDDNSMSDSNLTSRSSSRRNSRRHSHRSRGPRSLFFERPPYERSPPVLATSRNSRSILRPPPLPPTPTPTSQE